jgi:hypothetical protein
MKDGTRLPCPNSLCAEVVASLNIACVEESGDTERLDMVRDLLSNPRISGGVRDKD